MNRDLAAELRRAFDEGFREPAGKATHDGEALLAVRAGGFALALPVAQVRGLEKGRPVVPLPGARAGLSGLASVRGRLVPVFALAQVLGAEAGPGGWIALTAGAQPAGLAFDALIGLFDVHRSDFKDAGTAAPAHARAAVTAGDVTCWVLDLPGLMERLAAGARPVAPREPSR